MREGDNRATFGSSRFTAVRLLGTGGFGSVYLARDDERDETVALKVLRQVNPEALLRFKNEFRALADLTHRNLVSLYELIADGDDWLISMELVDGEDFLSHVTRGAVSGAVSASGVGPTLPITDDPQRAPQDPHGLGVCPAEIPRLRRALVQLVDGILALHGARKLHCDIKPANALVEPGGRVVLLDFGLVTELGGGPGEAAPAAGTPSYMAPEQLLARELTPATDWYGVGVLLYQALTGAVPQSGRFSELVRDKLTRDPPPPGQVVAGVPEDLDRLCVDLLCRDPRGRPTGDQVLQRLGAGRRRDPADSAGFARPPVLIGREAEWHLLDAAFQRVREGRPVVVHVHGESGVGKTTLCNRFVDHVHEEERVVALRGRCYEQESVPYKALDSLVDALSRQLSGLPAAVAREIVPAEIAVVADIFPVLSRLGEGGAPATEPAVTDPTARRRLAFRALRELLARACQRWTVVLLLDDVHWGDLDSASLLRAVLAPPRPPALLVVACYRSEAMAGSPFVRRLRDLPVREGELEQVEVELRPLDRPAAISLAAELLEEAARDEELVHAVAREGAGNPFFIQTLASYVSAREHRPEIALEHVLSARLKELPAEARDLLEVLAVAGLPLSQPVLRRVAGMRAGQESTALRAVRIARMARTVIADEQVLVEPYHDQIRGAVREMTPPERRRALHLRLAETLESFGEGDPETLASHFEAGGELGRAMAYVERAAERAAKALAFDRAASLYRRALAGAKATGVGELKARLADALSNAGDGTEAAPLYLESAGHLDAGDPVAQLRRRRAAEEWMKNGHIEAGLEVLEQVLAADGMKLAATPRRALLAVLARRARLALRGMGYTLKDSSQLDRQVLAKIDLCWAVWLCLAMADVVRAIEFHTLSLMLALDAGEPYRLARALAMEATVQAAVGAHRHPKVHELLALARELAEIAEPADRRHVCALIDLADGFSSYLEGRFCDTHEPCVRAGRVLCTCPGATWENSNARLYELEGLAYTGRLSELRELLPHYVEEAQGHGNLYGALSLLIMGHFVHLADDDPDGALAQVERGIAPYTRRAVHLAHYWDFYARGQILLYRGDGAAAVRHVADQLPRLRRAQILRVQVARVGAYYLRARCHLLAARQSARPRQLQSRALADARRMEREHAEWGQTIARQTRAGVAAQQGRRDEAIRLLEPVVAQFERMRMVNYAAAARWALGRLVGGRAGGELVAQSEAEMIAQQIRNPSRLAATLAAGFAFDRAD